MIHQKKNKGDLKTHSKSKFFRMTISVHFCSIFLNPDNKEWTHGEAAFSLVERTAHLD